MNNRIKDLAEKVHVTPESYKLKGEDEKLFYDFREDVLEKFTKSVVNEVTNIILHYTNVEEGVRVAKKHFGIEE
jgi:hypothetical protein